VYVHKASERERESKHTHSHTQGQTCMQERGGVIAPINFFQNIHNSP
jgi:hypothetical protein